MANLCPINSTSMWLGLGPLGIPLAPELVGDRLAFTLAPICWMEYKDTNEMSRIFCN